MTSINALRWKAGYYGQRFINHLLRLLALSCLTVGIAQATTYYVASSGGDSNSGIDTAHPWAHAPGMTGCASVCASTTLSPGDSVLLNSGDVFRVALVTTFAGAEGNPINWGAYGTGTNPAISGAALLTNWTSESEGTFTAYYSTSVSTLPRNVLVDASSRLVVNSDSKTTLTPGQWFWDSVNKRVYTRLVGDNSPSGHIIEGTEIGIAIDNKQSYLTFTNISVYGSTSVNYYDDGANNTVSTNLSSSWSDSVGVLIRGANSVHTNLSASNNIAYGIELGNIITGAQNITLNNPTAQHNGQSGILAAQTPILTINGGESSFNGSATVEGNGIGISSTGGYNASNITINNFNSHDNQGNGITVVGNGTNGATGVLVNGGQWYGNANGPAPCSGIRFDTNTNNSTVEYVVSYNNQSAGIVVEDNSHDNTIIYNRTYGNLRGITHSNGTGANVVYYGNVAYGNSLSGFEVSLENGQATIKNNILMNNGINGYKTDGSGTDVVDFNDVFGNPTNYSGIAKPPHDINVDPLFLNAAGKDFRLKPRSPATDTGTNLGKPYNLALDPTALASLGTLDQSSTGSGWEMGAFVYLPGALTVEPPTIVTTVVQ